MSDSNQIIINIADETTYGQARGEVDFYKLGVTGVTLAKKRSSNVSAELRDDRNVADFRLGTTDVDGDISCELAYPSFEYTNGRAYGLGSLFRSALRRNNATLIAPLSASDISSSSVDNSFNTVGGTMPLVEAGDTVLVAGVLGATGNNGYATVVSRTTSKLIVSGKTLVTDSAGDSVTITPCVATPGKRSDGPISFAVEQKFDDVSLVNPYHHFSGCNVNSMNVKVPADGIATATFSVMGQDMTEDDSDALDANYNASTSERPADGYSGTVTIDGTENATITELDFTLSNNMASRHVIGTPLTQNHTLGQVNITGNMTAFFGSDATDLLSKFLDEEPVALRKTVVDPDGNKIEFRFPRIFLTDGKANTNGVSGEVASGYPFQAVYDETAGYALQIRFNRKPTA
jgi:hypothetical protein